MPEIIIDQDDCTGCGACVEICSVTHVYKFENKKAKVFSPSRCWECGQCVAVCPVDAITHSSFALDDSPLIERSENDLSNLMRFLSERRSIRVYKKKKVERNIVKDLINTARWAPSGRNMQAVEWIAVDDTVVISELSKKIVDLLTRGAVELRTSANSETNAHEKRLALMQAKTYEHLERRMGKGEQPIFFGAPVILFAATPHTHFGRDDAVIAGYTMQLAAVQMGLATCQIGYFIAGQEFDTEIGKDILEIPKDHRVQMVLTLGYPKYQMHRIVTRAPHSLKWIDQ